MVAATLALATSIYNFSSVWMAPYMVKAGAKQVFHHKKLGDVYFITAIISLVLTFLGLCIVIFLEHFKIVDLQLLILLLFGLFFLDLLRIGFEATQSFRGYGYSLWLDKILYLIAIMSLWFSEQLESNTALYANSIAMLLVAILGIIYFTKKYISFQVYSFKKQEFFKTTIPILFSTIAVYFVSPPFVILLVTNLSGLEQAAFISVAFVITGFFIQPIQWITPTLLPKFTVAIESGNEQALRDQFDKVVMPFVILYSIGVIIFMIIALLTPMIPYVIGTEFTQSIPIIILIVGTVIAKLIHMLIVSMLYARQQETFILIASIAGSLSFLSIALLFVKSQLFLLGLLLADWIIIGVEIWALRDLVSWHIRLKLLLLCGLFITLGFLILVTTKETVLIACAFILVILGLMAFKHRNIFWSYLKSYA
jgi:O-antigen/teichoic acid export membrane protein